MPLDRARLTPTPLLARVALTLICLIVGTGTLATRAQASQTQVSVLEADSQVMANPTATLQRARQLGFQVIRLAMRWQNLAPSTNSFSKPAGFVPGNPGAYPAANWAGYDAVMRAAAAEGITVDLDVAGGAPLWATGPGMPRQKGYPFHAWKPNAVQFGQFVRAVAIRYSGKYDPRTRKLAPGNPNDLPRVTFWSLWNEPDYGPSLAPQAIPGSRSVPEAPSLFRGLVDQGWAALQHTGHGSDTILWGELAPRGEIAFGAFNGMTPIPFLRALYCVGANYQPLRGAAAQAIGCPTTAGASAGFAAAHPALFHAAGVSVHPYMRWFQPNQELNVYPRQANFGALLANYTSLATISHLERGLDRLVSVYHSNTRFPIWDTEFGYITSPPKRRWSGDEDPYLPQATAAYYDNWAEYISWKDPRISSFDQYLIQDPLPATRANDYGQFASGLVSFNGSPKPGLGAFRMPVFMPSTTASSPSSALELWGGAKAMYFGLLDVPAEVQPVQVIFAPTGTSSYSLLDTVTPNRDGYFDVREKFPSSGTVVLRWSYPNDPLLGGYGSPVYSRHVQVTVQ
jgi:hypothetical protein